jgi:hypothetical protein
MKLYVYKSMDSVPRIVLDSISDPADLKFSLSPQIDHDRVEDTGLHLACVGTCFLRPYTVSPMWS